MERHGREVVGLEVGGKVTWLLLDHLPPIDAGDVAGTEQADTDGDVVPIVDPQGHRETDARRERLVQRFRYRHCGAGPAFHPRDESESHHATRESSCGATILKRPRWSG